MSDLITIARPYANAVFELALEQDKLKEWSETLQLLGRITADPAMMKVLENPLISKDKLVKLFVDITPAKLSEQTINLLNQLAVTKKLTLLPAISKVYETCLAERERIVDVKVVSAFQIDETRLKKLQTALQTSLKRQVNLQFAIDRDLLGGAIIYAGDQVIDGSIRGKLNRLSERLCS